MADEQRGDSRPILIAEDNEINQLVIRQQMELLGYDVAMANDGVDALRLWRTGAYPLLLTDLHMPEMNGYALAQAIREEERSGDPGRGRTSILVYTADAFAHEGSSAEASGIDEYLAKPLRIQALDAAIRRWLPHGRPPIAHAEPATRHPLPAVSVR